jgi:hypothetical protein
MEKMKRIGVVGLCFATAFVLCALAASSAVAGEYGECVKAPQVSKRYTGRYLDAGCEKAASGKQIEEGKVNKYNWQMLGREDRPFRDTGSKSTFKSKKAKAICTSSTSEGEILGWQKNVERITLVGCELIKPQKLRCLAATGSEAIVSNKLDTYLIDHGTKGPSGLEPKENQVWNEYESSEDEPYLFVIQCGEIQIRILGTISGVVSPVSKMATSSKVKFTAKGGEQDLLVEALGVTEPMTWTTTQSITYKSDVEVRPCNEKGAPPEGKEVLTCENEELPLPWEQSTS